METSQSSSTLKPKPKARVRRSHSKSRQGCQSCKRLRIKCNEGRPKCEYCDSTNRVCEYPSSVKPPDSQPLQQQQLPPSVSSARAPTLERPIATPTVKSEQLAPDIQTLVPYLAQGGQSSLQSDTQDLVPHLSVSLVSQSMFGGSIQEEDEELSNSTGYAISNTVKAPTSQAFRNIPFSQIIEFYVNHSAHNLSLSDKTLYNLWSVTVPQVAYNSPMVSNAMVAYSALVLSKNKPGRQANLERLAVASFNNCVRMLGMSLSKQRPAVFEEIYVSSCLIAAYTLIDPDTAPLFSPNQESPDLLGIMRGIYHASLYGASQASSPLAPLFLESGFRFPTAEELANLDVNGKQMGYFKLLLDQLDSMAAGNEDISILCDPIGTATCFSSPTNPDSSESSGEPFNPHNRYDRKQSHSEFTTSPSCSSETTCCSEHCSPPKDSTASPTHTQTTSPSAAPSHQPDPLFTLLPGEFETYQTMVYSIIFFANEAMIAKRPSVLVSSLSTSSDEYVRLLRSCRPMAVVIAAFLLSQLEFLSSFPDYKDSIVPRFRMLEANLAPEWRPALYWPKKTLEEGVFHESLLAMMESMSLG